jgi:hypothetical protein
MRVIIVNPGAPTIFLGLCLFSLLNAGAHAELHDRGAGLIYDDVLDVTWLQNVTLAAGSSYDDDYTKTPSPNPNTDGLLSYANAVAWAENLKYYDSVRGITWDDWRLPKVRPVNGTSFNLKSAYDGSTDVGYNITSPTHELAYMYYVNLKNKGQYDTAGVKQTGYGLVDDPDDPNDESLFINLRNGIFWYGTRRPEGFNPNNAWDLRARYGNDLASDSRYVRYAWAVRDGDVGFAAPIQISQISATPASLLDTETSQLAVTANDPEPGPSELTYQWSVIAGGGTFDNASIASPTYTPEDVSDSQTVTIEVEVSDGENSVRRTLALQVSDGNVPLPNSAPQITGVSATPTSLLDTELSNLAVIASDPDNGPQSLSYQWIIVTGGGVLDDATSATPVFTPADVTGSQTVTLRVTVSDGAASASQDVALNVQDADPPSPGDVRSGQTYTYDFVWWSGASQTWVYDAGAMLSVDVYDAPETPENDVYFKFRNGINTELGYLSSIPYVQIDTGTHEGMFTSVSVSGFEGHVEYEMNPPGDPETLIDLSGSRIAWAGDFAPGVHADSTSKTYGINPGESQTIKVVVSEGHTFADVISAINAGMSTTFVDGHYGEWTTSEKQAYRVGASGGLRFALGVLSIVPNTWNPEGHGLFVTHQLTGVVDGNAPKISTLSATPASLLDTETSQLAVTANDPEPGPSELTYQWSVIAGGGTFDNASIASPTYTPEDVSDSQTVTIEVEVSDGENSVRRTLALQVSDGNVPLPNSAPQITGVSATPTSLLDTELSNLAVIASDPDNGPQSLSYQWIIVTGGGVLDDATSATPVFTPADVTGSQTVTLRVTVSDGAASASQDVALNVQDADPPAPGVELLAQDFSGTTLTDWLATDEGSISAPSKWRVASGELAQLSNIRDGGTANALPHLGTFLTYQGGLDWTDYRAKFRLRSADDDTLGLMFRVQDNDNYYRFSWDKSLNQRRLVKRVGGLFTELAADNVPYVVGQTYQLEMVAQGSQLEVWIDGVRIFQVTDGALDHGTIAFYTWQNNAAYFDELVVEDLSGGTLNARPQITGVSATPTSLLDTELSNLAVIASDPDNGPQSLSYQWIIVTGGGVLDDATSATPVFTPADVTGSQTVTLRVTVSDGAASASQDVALNVQDADPPAPGVELLAQDFSGTTLTDWLATDEGSISAPSKWRVASGELAQLSNIRDGGTANALPHLGTFLTYQGGLDWTDYRAKFRLRSADDDTLGLMFRVQDNDNYYRFSWDKSLNQRRLVKRVGGLFTELAADNVPYVVGQTYQLEMVAQGSQLEVWIDGVRIFQVTDGALDHGTIAFYTWQNNAAYFDELKADSIN